MGKSASRQVDTDKRDDGAAPRHRCRGPWWLFGLIALIAWAWLAPGVRAQAPTCPCPPPWQPPCYCAFLPLMRTVRPVCSPIAGVTYATIPVDGAYPPGDPPADQHPDLNLALRGYRVAPGNPFKGLVEYNGDTDPAAPRLTDLFADRRTPVFRSLYQVSDWDGRYPGSFWPITDPVTTMAGLAATPGEVLLAPGRYPPPGGPPVDIYQGHYYAMVLYASEQRITLKYTRDDNVIRGYTIHLENICVEPTLLALYRASVAEGRHDLPGLRARQALGRAREAEVKVAIRDNGTFMDPRSHKDWWRDVSLGSDAPTLNAGDAPWFLAHQAAIQARREAPQRP